MGPQGPAGVVDEDTLNALREQIAALRAQTECQRIMTVLKTSDALTIKIQRNALRWVGLNMWTARILGIGQADARACVRATYGEDVVVLGWFGF
jgi:predicted sugar kinase